MSRRIIIEKDVLEKVYNEYVDLKKTAKYFNCCGLTISKLLKKYNIPIIDRKYTIDHTWFLNKNNSTVLYWLGYICADGHVSKDKNMLVITSKDRCQLELFKKHINAGYNIRDHFANNNARDSKWKNSKAYRFYICSKKLVASLEVYGLGPAKSLTMIFPEILKNNKNIQHFWRGYIDGDGSWCVNKKNQLQFHLRGTEQFLYNFLKTIVNEKVIPKDRINQTISFDSGIYSLQFNGNNICSDIINWLYKDCDDAFLARKYQIIKPYLITSQ